LQITIAKKHKFIFIILAIPHVIQKKVLYLRAQNTEQ